MAKHKRNEFDLPTLTKEVPTLIAIAVLGVLFLTSIRIVQVALGVQ